VKIKLVNFNALKSKATSTPTGLKYITKKVVKNQQKALILHIHYAGFS
jgi:hypothetical protein